MVGVLCPIRTPKGGEDDDAQNHATATPQIQARRDRQDCWGRSALRSPRGTEGARPGLPRYRGAGWRQLPVHRLGDDLTPDNVERGPEIESRPRTPLT